MSAPKNFFHLSDRRRHQITCAFKHTCFESSARHRGRTQFSHSQSLAAASSSRMLRELDDAMVKLGCWCGLTFLCIALRCLWGLYRACTGGCTGLVQVSLPRVLANIQVVIHSASSMRERERERGILHLSCSQQVCSDVVGSKDPTKSNVLAHHVSCLPWEIHHTTQKHRTK